MELFEEAILFYADHPYEFVVDIIEATPTDQQKQILKAIPNAIKERKGISVKAGHGVGKTTIESWVIIWFMTCFPFPKVPCTAPTQHQLYDVLWSELAKWHKKSKVKEMFEWRKTHFWNKDYSENWFAVAQTSKEPDAMQGFHAEHLLFIIDEASGVPEDVMEVIQGTQTQENCLIMMFGNPTQIAGAFYNAFHSKRQFYKTFTLNSELSPLVDPAYCKDIADKFGKESDVYRVRVLGEFPNAEPDTLIPVDRCERASNREIEVGLYEVIELGIDVARYGDDETAIYSRVNKEISEEGFFRKQDIMVTVGEIVKVIRKYQKGKTILVNVDDSGVGGGVTDRLLELVREGIIEAEIFGVNNGSQATDKDRFINCGTEMWFYMREWLLEGKIPNDNTLIGQLSSRKHHGSSTGKEMLERKEQMKERGLVSPDRADAAILTLRSLIYGTTQTESRAFAC